MTVNLGGKYYENLERIGFLVRALRNGAMQERVDVLVENYDVLLEVEGLEERPNGSLCYFNGCEHLFDEIDTRVSLRYDCSGKVEKYQFHLNCLDELVGE